MCTEDERFTASLKSIKRSRQITTVKRPEVAACAVLVEFDPDAIRVLDVDPSAAPGSDLADRRIAR